MKQSQRRQPPKGRKKKIWIPILIGVLVASGATALWMQSQKQVIPTPTKVAPSTPDQQAELDRLVREARGGSKIAKNLEAGKFDEIRTSLLDPNRSEETASQMLRFMDVTTLDDQQKSAFYDLWIQALSAEVSTARVRVLSIRGLSKLALDPKQVGEVRKVLNQKINARISDLSRAEAYLGTVPYPKDSLAYLERAIVGKIAGLSREAAYQMTLIKDEKARIELQRKVLRQISKLNQEVKPFVVMILARQSDAVVRAEASYKAMIKMARLQSGALWDEVKRAIPNE